ncbi:MAG: Hpt domain-containing protein [Hyphomonadaceae bacterium]|nr:Hpt domain-containing protein [Hyphomonadaceae bacterium]
MGRAPLFDESAVARAEAALASLADNFQPWLEAEVDKVQAARESAVAEGWSDPALQALYNAAHDVKGLAATYDYPFVTRLAASLCRLIDTPAGKAAARARPTLVAAHVDAIRAAVRDRIKQEDDPIARALIRALEAQVEELGVAPR